MTRRTSANLQLIIIAERMQLAFSDFLMIQDVSKRSSLATCKNITVDVFLHHKYTSKCILHSDTHGIHATKRL